MKLIKTIFIVLMKLIVLIFITIVLIFCFLKFFSSVAFKIAPLEKVQLFIAAIAMPNDFLKPVLEEKLSLDKSINHLEYKFKIQYVGDKAVLLGLNLTEKLSNEILGGSGYAPGLELVIKIFKGENLLWQADSKKMLEPYENGNEIGFTLGRFNCTRDVPLDSELKLVIDVVKHDNEFEKNNLIRLKIVNDLHE